MSVLFNRYFFKSLSQIISFHVFFRCHFLRLLHNYSVPHLSQAQETNRGNITACAVRYSMLPYRKQGQLTCIPLYMACRFVEMMGDTEKPRMTQCHPGLLLCIVNTGVSTRYSSGACSMRSMNWSSLGVMIICVRRLRCLPTSVSLVAIGLYSPRPPAVSLLGSTPYFVCRY